MNYYYRRRWVSSAWLWEDGMEVDESELCEQCGKPTKNTYRDGCHICEDCAVNEIAARTDAAVDERRERWNHGN